MQTTALTTKTVTSCISGIRALQTCLAVRATALRVRSYASVEAFQRSGSDAGRSTVNAGEVAHFSKLSSLWWDEHGECAQLHRMNPIRMQFVREKVAIVPVIVQAPSDELAHEIRVSSFQTEIALEDNLDAVVNEPQILQGLDVLDVGCGGGLLCESLTRLGANTLGIDASSSNIQIATLHATSDPTLRTPLDVSTQVTNKGKGRLAYQHTTVEDLLAELGPGAFDIVCSMEVIEHVDNPRRFLSSCAQLVKPGGHLFLSTISRTPLGYFLTICMAEDALRLVEPGTHTFSKFLRPDELEGFFREYRSPSATGSPPRPWITGSGRPSRIEAETRGMVYLPWKGGWQLAPRFARWAEGANYCFWVRRPVE